MKVINFFQRRTLLNHLAAPERINSAMMSDMESGLAYLTGIRQLAADLKTMDVTIRDEELCMTNLLCLTQRFDHLLVGMDTIAEDEKQTVSFVKGRLLQNEQWMNSCTEDSTETYAALLST